MTDQEILKYGEIQYLKGRLDELHKALPTITNLERKRKLDQRIEKYHRLASFCLPGCGGKCLTS